MNFYCICKLKKFCNKLFPFLNCKIYGVHESQVTGVMTFVIVSKMSDKARKAFEEFDEDGDGFVDKFELKRALEKAGQQPSIKVIERCFPYNCDRKSNS